MSKRRNRPKSAAAISSKARASPVPLPRRRRPAQPTLGRPRRSPTSRRRFPARCRSRPRPCRRRRIRSTQNSSGGDFMVDVLQGARHRIPRDELRLELPRPARGDDQPRRQREARNPHLPARRDRGAYGAGLRQDRRQADRHDLSTAWSACSMRPWRCTTPGAIACRSSCSAATSIEANKRAPGAEWVHAAIDPGALCRDFTKWDDQPTSLQHFAESFTRAYKIAMTPPMGPVMLSLDGELQENPIMDAETLRIPRLNAVTPPQGDTGSLAELAKMLVDAENPVLIVDRVARTPAGMPRLVELAETLQCAVIDAGGRMNFPSRHPLNQSFRRAVIGQADVIVAMEMNELLGRAQQLPRPHRAHVAPELQERRQDRHARQPRSVPKGELSGLRPLSGGRSHHRRRRRGEPADADRAGEEADHAEKKAAFEARGKKHAAARLAMVEQAKSDATIGWDASPMTTGAAVRRALRADQERRLVVRRPRHSHRLAAPAVGFQEAVSVERRLGRRWRRLHAAGRARRGARQQEARPLDGRDRRRWRLHVQSRHAVDGGASPDPDALHRPQQPRLSPGIHVPAGDGEPAQPRHRERRHRHHDQRPEYRLRDGGARHGRSWRRPDQSIRRTSRPRSSARSRWSRVASRRWSMS